MFSLFFISLNFIFKLQYINRQIYPTKRKWMQTASIGRMFFFQLFYALKWISMYLGTWYRIYFDVQIDFELINVGLVVNQNLMKYISYWMFLSLFPTKIVIKNLSCFPYLVRFWYDAFFIYMWSWYQRNWQSIFW